MTQTMSANSGLDLVRATEAAALAAGRWMGLSMPAEADHAADLAMRRVLDTIEMDGHVVIGEENKLHETESLISGCCVGTGRGVAVDIVADPVDGRKLVGQGSPGAIAVAAVAPRGSIWAPPHAAIYMDKIVVSADVGAALVPECMDAPAGWTLALVARATGKRVADLVVYVLARPRHVDLLAEIRAAGARVMLSPDGDVAGALLATIRQNQVDILMGIGGILEGLIAACAVKATGGAILGRLAPQSEAERDALLAAGTDMRRVLTVDELVTSNQVFFAATGITDGPLLEGVRYVRDRATSNSLILRGETRTRRRIHAEHLLEA